MITTGIIALLVALIFIFIFTRWLTAPITKLIKHCKRVFPACVAKDGDEIFREIVSHPKQRCEAVFAAAECYYRFHCRILFSVDCGCAVFYFMY